MPEVSERIHRVNNPTLTGVLDVGDFVFTHCGTKGDFPTYGVIVYLWSGRPEHVSVYHYGLGFPTLIARKPSERTIKKVSRDEALEDFRRTYQGIQAESDRRSLPNLQRALVSRRADYLRQIVEYLDSGGDSSSLGLYPSNSFIPKQPESTSYIVRPLYRGKGQYYGSLSLLGNNEYFYEDQFDDPKLEELIGVTTEEHYDERFLSDLLHNLRPRGIGKFAGTKVNPIIGYKAYAVPEDSAGLVKGYKVVLRLLGE
ncbi:hypothetical protein HYU23_01370 [Candidatus Woesearchaeota archaeon]|nr:hypothetical protein [Candidatus Woesearchaeota archaeon]